MITKSENFVKTLKSKLYQYSFNRKVQPSLKGSFTNTTFISDIDFTVYVHFNKKFIEILVHKLKKLKDFKFLYLNAGINKHFRLPWSINPDWGCDFDLEIANQWFEDFKQKKLIPEDSYKDIEKILYKKKLILGDLVDIQDILDEYNVIKWFLPDIEKGTKTVDDHTYILLDELKTESGSVLNSIYIDGNDIVSVDMAIVDKQYMQPIWSRMYKYYTQNWYRILKSYKKLISKDYAKEYWEVMKTLEYDNALLAQASLLNSLMKYKPVNQDSINRVAHDLHQRLENDKISLTELKKIVSVLKKRLNDRSQPYVDYFLDKLTHHGKIKTYQRLRLTTIASIPTSRKRLIKRREEGIKCPFFDNDTNEFISNLALKLLLDKKKLQKCLIELADKEHEDFPKFVRNVFHRSPVSRLFLQFGNSKNKIYIRGAATHADHELFLRLGEKENEFYSFDVKYHTRLQIYLITGY